MKTIGCKLIKPLIVDSHQKLVALHCMNIGMNAWAYNRSFFANKIRKREEIWSIGCKKSVFSFLLREFRELVGVR